MRICYERGSRAWGNPCVLKLSTLLSGDQLYYQCVNCMNNQAMDKRLSKPVTVKPKTVYTDWGAELMEELDRGNTHKYYEKHRGRLKWHKHAQEGRKPRAP